VRGIPEEVHRPSSRWGKTGALASVAVRWTTGLGFGVGLGLDGVGLGVDVEVLVALVVVEEADEVVGVLEAVDVLVVVVVVAVVVVVVAVGVEPPFWARPPFPPPTVPWPWCAATPPTDPADHAVPAPVSAPAAAIPSDAAVVATIRL
jgi:hypothetical protein